METTLKTKHMILIDKLVKRMKRASYALESKGLDEPMLYSIAHRIYNNVDDLSKITIRVANKEVKIKKDITNKKIVKLYNSKDKKGARIKYENVISLWGYPIIGRISKITEETNEGENIIRSEIEPCRIDKAGIYVVLKEVGNNSVSYINNTVINKYERRYHVVLFKIDEL